MFWIDSNRNLYISEKNFIEDINQCKKIPKYIRSQNPYTMLVYLVSAMIHEKEVYLLDADFSDYEIKEMGIDIVTNADIFLDLRNFSSLNEIILSIKNLNWKLWLFTSGTTGLPKKVCHTFTTLGRNVRSNKHHSEDIWAFAYNMAHMAGIQVLLQALINHNEIVYVFESSPKETIIDLQKYHCTHISATPTFYRNIIPYLKSGIFSLKSITIGGEGYDENLIKLLLKYIPKAKINNIYASTETGSLLNSSGKYFFIPDKFKNLIRISPQNELLVHRSLLGNFKLDNEWYNTHDIVNENNGALFFVSRQNDLINVGGYKVNPLEVEDLIEKIDGVLDCVVKGKSNSVLGNILIANVVLDKNINEKKIKHEIIIGLRDKLQSFKIPRIIQVVDSIARTRTGKKVRK